MQLVLKYSFFAVIATLVNLAAQEISTQLYQGVLWLYMAIGCGTFAGLICKYVLDKKYIFAYQSISARDNANKFFLYGVTGVLTTLLFWGFELGFESYFGTRFARYCGAIIGLSIGYVVKYQLDKQLVFKR